MQPGLLETIYAIMKRLTSRALERGGLTGHPTHTAYWPPTLHKI